MLGVPERYGKRACVDHMEMVVEKLRPSGGLLLVFHVVELFFNKDIEMS